MNKKDIEKLDKKTSPPTLDPLDALLRLTPAEIERRLDEIDGESQALRTILRSLRARERARQRHQPREAAR